MTGLVFFEDSVTVLHSLADEWLARIGMVRNYRYTAIRPKLRAHIRDATGRLLCITDI